MKKVESFLFKNKINLKMKNVDFPIFSNRNSLFTKKKNLTKKHENFWTF